MFGLRVFQPKNTSFWVSLSHISIFLIDAVNSFLKNASITHFKFVETRPRDYNFFYKNKVKFVD